MKNTKSNSTPSIVPPASYFEAKPVPMHKCADCPTMISLSRVRCYSCYEMACTDSWDVQ